MKKNLKIILIIIGALILLSGGIWFAWKYYQFNKITTIITMDVNPSIEINLNDKDKVVKVVALNDDGKSILKKKNFKGNTLKKAINSITTTLIEQKYLADEKNYILINVTGKDIKSEVSNVVDTSLKNNNIECDIILEEVTDKDKEEAKKYGISPSKSSYIEKIIETNEDLTYEILKDKSINEINEIVATKIEEKKQEEEKRLAEEAKKAEELRLAEEAKKAEETKKVEQTNTNKRYGSIYQCEKVKANFSREDAIKASFDYLGLNYSDEGRISYQTIAELYSNTCVYETKLVYNKKFYKLYHNIVDGSLVHQEQKPWAVCNYEDLIEIANNYFVNTYSATKEEVQVTGGGGTVNETTSDISVTYKNEKYIIIVYQETGAIKSVTKK